MTTYEDTYTPVRTTPSYDRTTYMNMYNPPSYQGNYHNTPSIGNLSGIASMNAMTANASLASSHSMTPNHSMGADHIGALTPNPNLATMATMATNANLPTMATNANMGSMAGLSNMPGMFFSDFDYHQR